MKYSSNVVFSFLLLSFVISSSCRKKKDIDFNENSTFNTPPFFDVTGLNVNLTYWDNAKIANTNDTINFSNLRIDLDFEHIYLSQKKKTKNDFFSLFPSAHALSPLPPGYNGSKFEKLKSLKVITQYDYNQNFKAGDTLNKIINQFVTNKDTFGLDSRIELDTSNIKSHYLIVRLAKKPKFPCKFQLKVIAELSPYEGYEALSKMINILKE